MDKKIQKDIKRELNIKSVIRDQSESGALKMNLFAVDYAGVIRDQSE